MDQKQTVTTQTTLQKVFEKFVENTRETKEQNLKNIAEKFVIEKFTSKNSIANQRIVKNNSCALM